MGIGSDNEGGFCGFGMGGAAGQVLHRTGRALGAVSTWRDEARPGSESN